MSKQATKALIDEKITGNGVQAITGPILNNVLNTMVDDYGTQEEVSQLAQKVDGIPASETAITETSSTTKRTLNTDGTVNEVSSATNLVKVYSVEAGETYKISGRVGTTSGTCLYVFLDTNNVALSYGNEAQASNKAYQNIEATAPTGAVTVKVAGSNLYNYDASLVLVTPAQPGIIDRVEDLEDSVDSIETTLRDNRKEINNLDYAITEITIDQTDITEQILIQNGQEVPTTGAARSTKLIPYSDKNKYVYSGGLENYNLNAAAYYDATGTIVGYDNSPSSFISGRELTGIPSTTAFIRFCVWNVDERFKVEINSVVSELVDNAPYFAPKENKLTLDFTPGNTSSIISDFDDTNDLILQFNLLRNGGANANPGFNFLYAKTKNKSTGAETTVHDCQDDIAPTDFGGQYIGANHAGYGRMLITSNSHGKDYSDIGSIWSDGTHQFVLVGINNSNRLYLIGENTAVYPLFSFAQASSTATFTHVSGATHTASFTASAKTTAQWWPAFASPTTKVYLDGKEVNASGTYKFREMVVSEVYDVLNPASCLEIVKTNVGTYTENPKPGELSGADKYCRQSITYSFHGADKCIVAASITAYQDIGDGYCGFIQQAILSGETIKLYVPTVKSLENGTVQVDLRLPVTMDSSIENKVIKKTDCENPSLPADRWLQSSYAIGFYAGYLFDYGVGGNNRADALSTGVIHISSASKMYPRGVGIPMDALDNYSAVCFRNYLPIGGIDTGGIIAKNIFEYKDALYIYADFNAAGMYEIDIPEKYQGKQVEVFDKRDNVTLLTENASSTILVNVASSSPMTGYIVAKIK